MFCLMAVSLKYKWIFQPFCKLFAKQARLCKLVAGCMLSNCWSLSAWYRLHANIQVHSNLTVNKSAPLSLPGPGRRSLSMTTAQVLVFIRGHHTGGGSWPCPWSRYWSLSVFTWRWWFLTVSTFKRRVSCPCPLSRWWFLSVCTLQLMIFVRVHCPVDGFCPCPLSRLLFLSVCAS